jgi:hypothetical protein
MADPVCVFCGAPGPLTDEHIISQWISNDLKRRYPVGQWFRSVGGPEFLGVPERDYMAKVMDLKAKVVCGGDSTTCNNGWMRRLELQVQSVLSPMMRGTSRTLTLSRQSLVASWVSLKAFAGEFAASPNTSYFTTRERHAFRRNLRPPIDTAIWLATYIGPAVGTYVARPAIWTNQRGAPAEGYSLLMGLDRLIVILFSHRLRPFMGSGEVVEIEVPFADAIVPIWPLEGHQRWPPPAGFDDASIQAWATWATTTVPRFARP